MAVVNYAELYSKALLQAFPYVLHFGALWNSPNKDIYKVVDADTIKIPHITTSGRVDGDRDTIGGFTRNHDNEWVTKQLRNHRTWETLIHPMDVQQTGGVMAIQNATKVYNQEQKFPEMDAYTISALYSDYIVSNADKVVKVDLTVDNVLSEFDKLMEAMDEARVPQQGRILYVTPHVKTLLKQAKDIQRIISAEGGEKSVNRNISRIDEVMIEPAVPSELMKTVYDFTKGWKVGASARQLHMLLIHPTAVLPCVNYTFAALDEPSAKTKGKQLYFEESFEDMFALDYKMGAIAFIQEPDAA